MACNILTLLEGHLKDVLYTSEPYRELSYNSKTKGKHTDKYNRKAYLRLR